MDALHLAIRVFFHVWEKIIDLKGFKSLATSLWFKADFYQLILLWQEVTPARYLHHGQEITMPINFRCYSSLLLTHRLTW